MLGSASNPWPGVVDRWFQQLLQRERAEQLVGAAHACRDAGHAYRAVSDGVGAAFHLVYAVACYGLADDMEHVGGCGLGSAMSIVDGDAALLRGHVNNHLNVAGDG